MHVRRRDVVAGVEGQLRRKARVVDIVELREFLLCARRIVAQALHPITGLAPRALQLDARRVHERAARGPHDDTIVGADGAEHMAMTAEPDLAQDLQHGIGIAMADLQHDT